MNNYSDKHILLFGLGLLGGGVATANWLIERGTKLIIADAKSKEELGGSMAKIKGHAQYFLNERLPTLDGIDILVLNPGVSYKHPIVAEARRRDIPVINEAVIFYNTWPGKIIGITGTRGKTTTAHWTAHLMGDRAILAGNSPEHPFLYPTPPPLYGKGEVQEGYIWAVTEISSFHLELFDQTVRPPDIAVLTNIYKDHLNRYDSFEEYVQIKKNLYRWQKPGQILITEKEAAAENLPAARHGVKLNLDGFAEKWGAHNLKNVRIAALAAHHAGTSWEEIQEKILTLPNIKFRQEIVHNKDGLMIINDSAATSPDGGIAALERFGRPDTVLIAGGTDAMLDFGEWEQIVARKIKPEHIILLNGSATKKLQVTSYKLQADTLEECLKTALELNPRIILFSPASKSFEKFANEYDRGRQFNALVKKLLKT